jgi:hypothetical protein
VYYEFNTIDHIYITSKHIKQEEHSKDVIVPVVKKEKVVSSGNGRESPISGIRIYSTLHLRNHFL